MHGVICLNAIVPTELLATLAVVIAGRPASLPCATTLGRYAQRDKQWAIRDALERIERGDA